MGVVKVVWEWAPWESPSGTAQEQEAEVSPGSQAAGGDAGDSAETQVSEAVNLKSEGNGNTPAPETYPEDATEEESASLLLSLSHFRASSQDDILESTSSESDTEDDADRGDEHQSDIEQESAAAAVEQRISRKLNVRFQMAAMDTTQIRRGSKRLKKVYDPHASISSSATSSSASSGATTSTTSKSGKKTPKSAKKKSAAASLKALKSSESARSANDGAAGDDSAFPYKCMQTRRRGRHNKDDTDLLPYCRWEGCGKQFEGPQDARTCEATHLRDSFQVQPFRCKIGDCGRQADTLRQLQRHFISAHEIRLIECEYCGCRFRDRYALRAHLHEVPTGRERTKLKGKAKGNTPGKPDTSGR